MVIAGSEAVRLAERVSVNPNWKIKHFRLLLDQTHRLSSGRKMELRRSRPIAPHRQQYIARGKECGAVAGGLATPPSRDWFECVVPGLGALAFTPPKARVNPVCVEREIERGLEDKDLRDCCPSLHTRKKFT